MKVRWIFGAVAVAALTAFAVAPGFARRGPAPVPCPSGSSTRPVVGDGSAHIGRVRINGVRRRSAALLSGNVVCTGKASFDFDIHVGSQHAGCKEQHRSSLRIHPSSTVLLRFFFGRFVCGTYGTKSKSFKGPGKVMIIAEDPVFSVSIDRQKTVVRVLAGSVLVIGKGGSPDGVVVGPAQQAIVRAGKRPAAATTIKLSPAEVAESVKFGRHEPPPDFSRPDPTGSPNLTRIFGRNRLSVAFDQASTIDAGTPVFVRTYLDFLAASWKVQLNLQFVPAGPALVSLANNRLDLVVASTTAFGFDVLPLLWDSSKKTWSVFVNQDKVYSEALRRFIVSTVYSRRYASFYRKAFGAPPSYEPLRPVLFPKYP